MRAKDTKVFVGIDTETTGLDYQNDRIIQAAVSVMPNDPYPSISSRAYHINPGIPIPAEATAIHGISDSDVAGYENEEVQIPKIVDMIYDTWQNDSVIVGHNLPYDLNMIKSATERIGMEPFSIKGPMLDSMVLYRMLGGSRASLRAVSSHFGIVNDDAHSAVSDAETSLRCVRSLLQGKFGNMDLRDLYVAQRTSHREHQDQLQARFLSQGRGFTRSEWPL